MNTSFGEYESCIKKNGGFTISRTNGTIFDTNIFKGGIMSQIQKLIDKLNSKPTPNDMTFEELSKIAKYYGCDTESRGNHQRAIVHDESGTVIPIPSHGKHVGVAYVKQVKALFASIDKEED